MVPKALEQVRSTLVIAMEQFVITFCLLSLGGETIVFAKLRVLIGVSMHFESLKSVCFHMYN